MSDSRSGHDLMLDLLELLAHGAMGKKQIISGLTRCEVGLINPGRRVGLLLEALEAEALIGSETVRGDLVYRVTASGVQALVERGRHSAALAFLFTDLVGSTRLIDCLGEVAADRLRRRHFSLLRTAIAAHGGREVKSLGDGLMVVFGDARRALRCAAAMQGAVVRDRDGLELRIGIHLGEPVRDGDDFFGTPVIIARRLCDAATGGQILVSERVRELVDLDAGAYEPLGALSLKGLSAPVSASVLRWTPVNDPVIAREGRPRGASDERPLRSAVPA
jgi:class 3 adenylate cyclase